MFCCVFYIFMTCSPEHYIVPIRSGTGIIYIRKRSTEIESFSFNIGYAFGNCYSFKRRTSRKSREIYCFDSVGNHNAFKL